jgi:predicted AAA+ superfamily ATPase
MMIPRFRLKQLEDLLARHAAVGLLGPRQVGKTTLAFQISQKRPSVYLDLELPSDRAKLFEPEIFLESHLDKLVILDEIHRAPGIFQILRSFIDRRRRAGQSAGMYLILGSASPDLLKQSAESLAGRIAYLELNTLSANEIEDSEINQLWLRGGFPSSFLATNDFASLEWRQLFIQTYLERDVPLLGPRIPAETLRRFWQMLAHNQGSLFNAGRYGQSLGISGQTVGRYLDLLCDLLLVRQLRPWLPNVRKRLVKSPKVFVRDCGITHALLNIPNWNELLGHPVVGGSFEGFVSENIISMSPRGTEFGFYRTAGGAEIDLVLSIPPRHLWAIEIKRSAIPRPERGFFHGCEDLLPTKKFVVYPGQDRFAVADETDAIGLPGILSELLKL